MLDMKRLVLDKLIEWRNADNRKPLVLNGARQVGKTYLLKEFGKNFYRKLHYLNFEDDESLHKVFEHSLKPQKIIDTLKIDFELDLDIESDLIFFDEIQTCPKALTSLKYFCEDLPQVHIVSAGSLLGIKLGKSGFPVGKIDSLELHPMNFSEFLLALGKKDYFEKIQQLKIDTEVSEITALKLWELLRWYFIVGGLPEVVEIFVKKHHDLPEALSSVREAQYLLIQAYNSDIAKHSGKVNSMHIEGLFTNAALQLGREENDGAEKFKLKDAIPGIEEYSRLENALNWLIKTGLIIKVPILKQVAIPLKAYIEENKFKLFIFDVGILGALADIKAYSILNYDYGTYKGFFAENFVAQELVAADSRSDRLFCWHGRSSEIEFVRDHEGHIVPLEVKSGTNTKSKSLSVFIEKYQPKLSVKISARKFQFNKVNHRLSLPLYAISSLNRILDEIVKG